MFRVIFACVHNAGRSQMASAFFNHMADPAKAEAISAGTEPGLRIHPEVLVVMQEIGIDLSDAKPQKLTEELARDAQLLITMGCGDQCPYVPGLRRDDWPLHDPKGLPADEVRTIRDDVNARVKNLIETENLGK
ncbi:arsenate reductase ArsC [Tunturibacter empetritectus]|uniref:arsenate reductase ArsC n=1 Tax=Tunturiibacter empetritectus TaxID=3069691 RepID=UPI001616DB23|nr:arsenate reductase ArsC [Edaphobacter lichenicola]